MCIRDSNNVAIGRYAIADGAGTGNNCTSDNNTVIGINVGTQLTTGGNNCAVGAYALDACTTGASNVCMGRSSLSALTTASDNTAIGHEAMDACTTGSYNTAVGYQALDEITTGTRNVAVGYRCLAGPGDGSHNTAVGQACMESQTTGQYNACFGQYAGQNSTTGDENTVIGRGVGINITTGGENVIIGSGLGTIGDTLTTGSRNVMIARNGDFAASDRTDALVISAGNTLVTDMGEGTSWIGAHNSSGNAGNEYRAQNESTWDTTSDRRIKKNIVDNNNGLALLNKIQVRNFEYRTEEEITELPSTCVVRSSGTKLGVIAQEVQDILPDIVEEGVEGCLSVKPDNITWYLVNAVKELSAENTALKARLDAAGL